MDSHRLERGQAQGWSRPHSLGRPRLRLALYAGAAAAAGALAARAGRATVDMTSGIAKRFRGFLPVVVDVETGGFNPATDALLEIAAVFVRQNDAGDIEAAERHRSLVKPFPGSKLEPPSPQGPGICHVRAL